MSNEIKGKHIAIPIADGLEQVEMTEPGKALDQVGAKTEMVSPASGEVQDEIAQRAYEIWTQKGRPNDSAEEDWFEAASQLRAKANSHNAGMLTESGSVQR